MNFLKICGVLCLLSVMLFLPVQGVLADSTPSDVPQTHWAYKAVKLLVDKGYLQLYQDQTFQGDKSIDRYTLAVVVAKILNEIAGGQVGATKEDMALLKSLTNEFRNELVDVNSKGSIFTRKLDQISKENQIIREDLTKTTAKLQILNAEQVELQLQAQQIIDEIQKLQKRVQLLEEENQRLKADLERTKAEAAETKKQHLMLIIAALVMGLAGAAK